MTPSELARRWRDADPDPSTRRRIDEVLARGDQAELTELFGHWLRFGTAGLRAPLGPGPARMNRLVMRRAAAAVAQYLQDELPDRVPTVVVGHDARHGSATFGADLVEVLRDAGMDVACFDEAVPTPLVATAVTLCGADAGLMVTASHNPATDNGLKLYAADGAQIVPPTDERIATILEALPLDPIEPDPVAAPAGDAAAPAAVGSIRHLGGPRAGGDVVEQYLDRAVGLLADREGGARATLAAPLRLVHTSLHGVGHALLEAALARVDGVAASSVADQQRPDPDFPTVASPNPEDPVALMRLMGAAARAEADVALALDPDADRLGVALPTSRHAADQPGGWQPLTGDQVGSLLAAHLLEHSDGSDRLVTTTVVSSSLVPAMCAAAGVHHVETLTGFKWLCRPALEHPGLRQLMAYEEALGYAIGADARDKDGITAALVLLDAVARWRSQGRSAWDVLDDLARRHGAHVTRNGALRSTSGGALRALLASWQDAPPRRLGGQAVVRADRPDDDVWRWWLEDDTRVVVRPSGTEPKVKYYLEAVEAVRGDPAAARAAAWERLDPVLDDVRVLLGS